MFCNDETYPTGTLTAVLSDRSAYRKLTGSTENMKVNAHRSLKNPDTHFQLWSCHFFISLFYTVGFQTSFKVPMKFSPICIISKSFRMTLDQITSSIGTIQQASCAEKQTLLKFMGVTTSGSKRSDWSIHCLLFQGRMKCQNMSVRQFRAERHLAVTFHSTLISSHNPLRQEAVF